jgi:hypothetical protein
MQYPTIASRREVAGADGSSSVRVMAKCRFPGMQTIRRFFDQPPKAKLRASRVGQGLSNPLLSALCLDMLGSSKR